MVVGRGREMMSGMNFVCEGDWKGKERCKYLL